MVAVIPIVMRQPMPFLLVDVAEAKQTLVIHLDVFLTLWLFYNIHVISVAMGNVWATRLNLVDSHSLSHRHAQPARISCVCAVRADVKSDDWMLRGTVCLSFDSSGKNWCAAAMHRMPLSTGSQRVGYGKCRMRWKRFAAKQNAYSQKHRLCPDIVTQCALHAPEKFKLFIRMINEWC